MRPEGVNTESHVTEPRLNPASQQAETQATVPQIQSVQRPDLPAEPSGLLTRLSSMEGVLLGLRDDLTATLKTSGINKKLDEMGDCLKTLRLNALQGTYLLLKAYRHLLTILFVCCSDEQPLPKTNWDNESAWKSLYYDLFSRTKEQAEGLKGNMDNNLVFVSNSPCSTPATYLK